MATAVNPPSETPAPADPRTALLLASAAGAIYVAACIGVVAFGIPFVWKLAVAPWLTKALGSFVNLAAMGTAILAAAVGLVIAGLKLAGKHPPEGLRAGVFSILAGLFLWLLTTVGIGQLLENYVIRDRSSTLGLALTIGFGIAILAGVVTLAMKRNLRRFMIVFESQGWFRASSYKPNQGQRVRRLTILGILVIIGSGIYALDQNRSLTGTWSVRLPYTGARLPLLPDAKFTVPFLLLAVGIWGSWRVVNYPTFADFLIATEAEMNKVSWSTRKRLVQDTIVVLVTVVLMSAFLLIVDQLWGWVLTRETLFGGIVPKPVPKAVQQNKETPW